ncbi:MAG: AAA family ATPase [Saprospiraceae bacterium]|jgi:SpoVK/Ycf46/Vps4 family AAA+-type ATPase|nr:AAA family ATPase [Saprospiraceae bacterium]MBK8298783.1 AAA family ATPase [Saprospiraceae bacterium]
MEEEIKIPETKKFKFKELKVYASTEWLADNKKKYRQVFDRFDTSYIYVELSFINKYFDKESWETDIELKCFSLIKTKKEVCNLSFRRKISKFDHTVFIREGWGNKKEGSFWKKGSYYWEAWMDGEKIGSKYFYIEDPGVSKTETDRPYIELQSLKLYEGPFEDVSQEERNYVKTFNGEETRYIYAELVLDNKSVQAHWQCELFVKFLNESRELKGQVTRLVPVRREDEKILITAGWGSNVKGSWWEGLYTVEIVFMESLLAVMPFEVAFEFEEGIAPITLPHISDPIVLPGIESDQSKLEDILSELNQLIGLQDIKRKVSEHAQYVKFLQLRQEKGIREEEKLALHSVFYGNPGTGKTTIAKMMGRLYRKMGVLSKGHVYEADRAELVGEYIGQTAPKVKEVIEKARGGVLFIDEAYALARTNDDSKDFGREVIEILVKEMSNGPGDLAVIMAGYPKEMRYFLDSNPGLKSRIKLYFEFPDYLPQELYEIASFAMMRKGVQFQTDAVEELQHLILEAYRNRDNTFGNARLVFDLVEKAKINLGIRVMSNSAPQELEVELLSSVTLEDVQKIELEPVHVKPLIPVDQELLQTALVELDQLVGIEKVKKEIRELVRIVQFARKSGKEVLNQHFLHTVFLGNPGTGKSTVARILAKIYKALGILERGHMVETDRQGLVAGYIGQSAIKTAEKIEEAMGGVLFIDEAYSLSSVNQQNADYGSEVIQTLLKRMEDQRGQFFVFVAGYTDSMELFLKSNPGLSSRFDKILKFEDYSEEELFMIAMKMFTDVSLHISDAADTHLRAYLAYLFDSKDKFFGNARVIRSICEEIIRFQNIRLSNLSENELLKTNQTIIELEDVLSFVPGKDRRDVFNRPRLGFMK